MKFLLVALAAILCACERHDAVNGSMADAAHMKSHQSRERFEKLLSEQSGSASPSEIVRCMFDFYRDVRAVDCDIDDDGE